MLCSRVKQGSRIKSMPLRHSPGRNFLWSKKGDCRYNDTTVVLKASLETAMWVSQLVSATVLTILAVLTQSFDELFLFVFLKIMFSK